MLLPCLGAAHRRGTNWFLRRRLLSSVGVFWDFDNLPTPNKRDGLEVVENIKRLVEPYGTLERFSAYGVSFTDKQRKALRGHVDVEVVPKGKDKADKRIIVDVMEFCYRQSESAAICLVSGDSDYTYMLSKLDATKKILIARDGGSADLLKHGDVCFNWHKDVLKSDGEEAFSKGTLAQHEAQMLDHAMRQLPGVTCRSRISSKLVEFNRGYFNEKKSVSKFLGRMVQAGVLRVKGSGKRGKLYYVDANVHANEVRDDERVSISEDTTGCNILDDISVVISTLLVKGRPYKPSKVAQSLKEFNPSLFEATGSTRAFVRRAVKAGFLLVSGRGKGKVLHRIK